MKKAIIFLCFLMSAAILALSGTLQTAQAKQLKDNQGPTSTPGQPGIADGAWFGGKEIKTDPSKIQSPNSDLQLLGKLVKTSVNGRICHPFRGGEYGWTGSIYRLDGEKWVKMKTYFIRNPEPEGIFMACTNGIHGNTYAFFGYYDGTVNPTATLKPSATPTMTPTPKPTSKANGQGEPTRMNRQ